MFVRFALLAADPASHSPQGVFQAAFALRDSGQLEPHEYDWIETELEWLHEHLPAPACLDEDGNHRAICWFRPAAREPIERVRSICALLEEHGYRVRMYKTRRPGVVVYEDDWQVAAKPHRRGAKHQDEAEGATEP